MTIEVWIQREGKAIEVEIQREFLTVGVEIQGEGQVIELEIQRMGINSNKQTYRDDKAYRCRDIKRR